MASSDPSSTSDAVGIEPAHAASDAWVVFTVDELEFALVLGAVQRVVRAVAVTPLPETLRGVRGMINLHGLVVPVFDLRMRLDLPPREVRASDHLVIARTHRRTVALLVDAVAGVVSRSEVRITPAADVLLHLETIEGVMTLAGNMVLVHDLERFLSIEEHEALQKMMPVPS
jgi:purine-binding chemotaxis protein CheW